MIIKRWRFAAGDSTSNEEVIVQEKELSADEGEASGEKPIAEDSSRQENEKGTTKARHNRNLNPIFEFKLRSPPWKNS